MNSMVFKGGCILFLVLAYSCNGKDNSFHDAVSQTNEAVHMSNRVDDSPLGSSVRGYSNPALFQNGSNLGTLLSAYYRVGDFEAMTKFTAAVSLSKYGKDSVKSVYQHMEFGYPLDLVSMNEIDSGVYELRFGVTINATELIRAIRCVVENDTAKVLIFDTDNYPFE